MCAALADEWLLLHFRRHCFRSRGAVGAHWRLPTAQEPPLLDGYNRDGLFLLAPHTAYLEYSLGEGVQLDIRRTHFQVLPADARVVHSAQGESIEANVIDMAKPPSMSEVGQLRYAHASPIAGRSAHTAFTQP